MLSVKTERITRRNNSFFEAASDKGVDPYWHGQCGEALSNGSQQIAEIVALSNEFCAWDGYSPV